MHRADQSRAKQRRFEQQLQEWSQLWTLWGFFSSWLHAPSLTSSRPVASHRELSLSPDGVFDHLPMLC